MYSMVFFLESCQPGDRLLKGHGKMIDWSRAISLSKAIFPELKQIQRRTLYPPLYFLLVRPGGFEPPTSCVSSRHSPPELQAQLWLSPIILAFTVWQCQSIRGDLFKLSLPCNQAIIGPASCPFQSSSVLAELVFWPLHPSFPHIPFPVSNHFLPCFHFTLMEKHLPEICTRYGKSASMMMSPVRYFAGWEIMK